MSKLACICLNRAEQILLREDRRSDLEGIYSSGRIRDNEIRNAVREQKSV
jgi:hypothetical protein